MSFYELMMTRRSCRSYTGNDIPVQDERKILEAGLRAPNACNAQSWHFYVVKGEDAMNRLIPAVCRQEWIKKTAFVVIITENTAEFGERFNAAKAELLLSLDAGAAAENMALMAAELGYASCFVGAFDEEACRAFAGAKAGEKPVVLLPVGVPAEEIPLRDRKPFVETVTEIV